MSNAIRVTGTLALALGLALAAPQANAAEREVILFQPGQSSWEWLLVPTSHDGGKRMREGKTCLFCHEGEQKTIGNLIASGEKIEPDPIGGMPGWVEMTVGAEYDAENLYLTLNWESLGASEAWGHEESAIHVTAALGTPDLNVAPIAGCWAACHSDLPGMPDATGDKLTKYLPGSRNKMTRTGGGTDVKGAAELAEQLAQGQYLEYWQAIVDGGALVKARDGYFLEERAVNEDCALTATVSSESGRVTVELTRPLAPAGEARHALTEGVEYTLAIALHENHASGRYHYTSFPLRFVLGAGEAELNADKR